MADPTPDDEAFAKMVQGRGHPAFSVRDAQFLRERDALPLPPVRERRGGKSKRTEYTSQCVDVAAAIEDAKSDPDYRRKFHRLILIAWANRAPVPDAALRRAFAEEYRRQREKRRTPGRDRRPGGGSAALPDVTRAERRSFHNAVDDLFSGESPTPAGALAFMKVMTRTLPDMLNALTTEPGRIASGAAVAAAAPQLLPGATEIATLVPEIVGTLGALPDPRGEERAIGGDEFNAAAAPIARHLLMRLSQTSGEIAAKHAPRTDLDQSRDLVAAIMPDAPAIDRAMAASDYLGLYNRYESSARRKSKGR